MDALEQVRHNHAYHKLESGGPGANTAEHLRTAFIRVAEEVVWQCPESRERSVALTKLEEASMWAIASVARNA